MRAITIGLLAASAQDAALIKPELKAAGSVLVAEVYEHCTSRNDRSARRLAEANPDIIILDTQDGHDGIQSLQTLHELLPNTWILVTSSSTDTDLIISCIRAGAREFLPKPVSAGALNHAFGRYIAEKERQRPQSASVRGKIYGVIAAKAGTGATTVAINLASALTELPGTRVGLVDLDRPLGDVAAYLNLKPQFSITDALNAAPRLDSVLLESFMNSIDGMSVLAGLDEFQDADAQRSGLARLLDVMSTTYTHTVIDLSPGLGKEELQAVAGMATSMVVVLTPDLSSIWRTDRLIQLLSGLDMRCKFGLLLNRYRKTSDITEKDVEKALQQSVAWKIANDYGACLSAIHSGQTLLKSEDSYVAQEFRKLARQLSGIKLPEKRRSILGLFPKLSSTGGTLNA